jgi:hypothetical protein
MANSVIHSSDMPTNLYMQQEQPQIAAIFCQTCHSLDRLIAHCPFLKCSAVKVLLGSIEYVRGKRFCPSCCSILTALSSKEQKICPQWRLVFYMGPHMWVFKLLYGDNIFQKAAESLSGNLIQLLPLRSIFPNRKYGRSFAHDHIDLALIFSWLRKCNSHGEGCNEVRQTGVPKLQSLYLIDVEAGCLISTSARLRYVALSYVWGQVTTFTTKRKNIQSLQRPGALGVSSISKLIPQTIRDAMHLTLCLKEKYLWVDSLCIVQDDETTKQRYLNAMTAIYANAYLTIVAADGINAAHGLRGIGCGSQPRSVSRSRIEFPTTKLIEDIHRNADSGNSTWASRAWTFQEALFSRRMLVFDGLISWVCSLTQYFEEIDLPPTWPDYAQSTELRAVFLAGAERLRREIFSWNDLPNLHCWRELVVMYQRRYLTYDSDVLNAFAGITSVLRPGFPGGFFYGLPEMFFDLALLWQPRSLPIRKISQKCNERNPNFPSWSWAGWKEEIDDRFWQKCFNHIFLLSGQTDDYIEIAPLVKWYKRSSKPNQLRLVSNSYHTFRSASHTKAPSLPPNWSHDEKENGYYWKDQDEPRKRFRYPIPIPTSVEERDDDTLEPYLYFKTNRAWLRLCSTPKDARSVFAASLHDKSDSWVGIIRLNPKEELSEPEIRKEVYEFISISLGKVPIVSDLNVTLPALPPDSVFRKEFGGRVLEEWDLIIERHRSSAFYEFYNVLWIERCNGVAYRKGLGRVMKDAWERQDLEEIKITLG